MLRTFNIQREIIREVCIEAECMFGHWKIIKKESEEMVLALEEALTNIYEHGYNFPKSVDCPVTVEIFEGISTVYVIIVDKAKPFSLQSCKSINTSTYVDSKIIGGFGVTIIKKMMDEVVLFPLFDENVLIMTKDVRYSI